MPFGKIIDALRGSEERLRSRDSRGVERKRVMDKETAEQRDKEHRERERQKRLKMLGITDTKVKG